jgi:Domain of unknown function (DUF4276)
MKRIIIVVEGQTERDFVKYCLAPYLVSKFGLVSVSARLIGKPGHINDKNPPSYRMTEIFKQHQSARYDKVAFGNILALETDIETILTRCPRFAAWVARLVDIAQH